MTKMTSNLPSLLSIAILITQVFGEGSAPPQTSSFQPSRSTLIDAEPQFSLSKAKLDIPDFQERDDDNLFWKSPIDSLEEDEGYIVEPNDSCNSMPSLVSLHLEGEQTITETTSNNRADRLSHFKKTGTTIAGCCVPDNHVVLAADTRATEDTMVADKTCQKLHCLSQNAWCAGAGTSADLDHLTKQILYSLSLHSLQIHSIGNDSKNNPNIVTNLEEGGNDGIWIGSSVSIDHMCRMIQDALWQARGQLGANIILGGVYKNKAYLRAIHPHGSMDVDLPFAALGSGGLAAMGVLEKSYAKVQTVEDGIELCKEAILAGIRNDLGSGSQVDICVIYPDGTSRLQRCAVAEEELLPLEETEETKTTETTSNLGVNGFGNLPFGIKSKKVRMVSILDDEQKTKELLDDLLFK